MKNRFAAACALGILLLASGNVYSDDKEPRLHAHLRGSQEVPVVLTVATGELRGVIDAGDQSMTLDLTYSGLQGTVTQQAHIHIGQRNVNGGIVIWLCQSTSNPAPTGIPLVPDCTNGSGNFHRVITAADVVAIAGANVGQQVGAGQFAKVLGAIRNGQAYANVHTNASTGGEIRGQIKVVRDKKD